MSAKLWVPVCYTIEIRREHGMRPRAYLSAEFVIDENNADTIENQNQLAVGIGRLMYDNTRFIENKKGPEA